MRNLGGAKRALLVVIAALFVIGMLGMAGCSCSSKQTEEVEGTAEMASSTDVMYTVPNVVSLTQSDAEKSIHASGLQVGTVKQESSDTVPLGTVISQDPKALTNAHANSKVNLVVSSGKKEAKEVAVPDLKGKSQSEAKTALDKIGLVGIAANPEESTAVKPGLVFKQSVAPGTKVKEGTKVTFTTALAPAQSTVPDVTGKSLADAKKAIEGAKLGFDHTSAYNDKVAKDLVAAQSIKAGEKVKAGTTVTVTVSLGKAPVDNVKVPDVISYSWTDAKAAMRSAGLSIRYTGDPAGVVVSQDIKAGTMVAPNTLVTVQLSTPVEMVEVPDLIGMSVTSAEEATDALNLALDASANEGTVVEQWPEAGKQVEARTTIRVTVEEPEPEPVPEPDEGDETPAPDEGDQPADDQDEKPWDEQSDEPAADEPADEPAAPEVKPLDKDDAKRIALTEAKLEEKDAAKIKVDLIDKDVEVPYYVVDVVKDDVHHFFRIQADTGRVLAKLELDTDEDPDPFDGKPAEKKE